MGGLMETLVGGKQKDSGMAEQQRLVQEKEKRQAQEMKNRRQAIGGQSKTVFSAVEGIGQSTAKKTKLGG